MNIEMFFLILEKILLVGVLLITTKMLIRCEKKISEIKDGLITFGEALSILQAKTLLGPNPAINARTDATVKRPVGRPKKGNNNV